MDEYVCMHKAILFMPFQGCYLSLFSVAKMHACVCSEQFQVKCGPADLERNNMKLPDDICMYVFAFLSAVAQ